MKELPVDPNLIDDPWIFDKLPGLDVAEGMHPAVAERIKSAVEDLPPAQRDVVECLVWGQMSKVEAATTLGVTRQTVHDLYRKATRTLQVRLQNLVEG